MLMLTSWLLAACSSGSLLRTSPTTISCCCFDFSFEERGVCLSHRAFCLARPLPPHYPEDNHIFEGTRESQEFGDSPGPMQDSTCQCQIHSETETPSPGIVLVCGTYPAVLSWHQHPCPPAQHSSGRLGACRERENGWVEARHSNRGVAHLESGQRGQAREGYSGPDSLTSLGNADPESHFHRNYAVVRKAHFQTSPGLTWNMFRGIYDGKLA